MPRTQAFDMHQDQYEDWFVRNRFAFESELLAIRNALPKGRGGRDWCRHGIVC